MAQVERVYTEPGPSFSDTSGSISDVVVNEGESLLVCVHKRTGAGTASLSVDWNTNESLSLEVRHFRGADISEVEQWLLVDPTPATAAIDISFDLNTRWGLTVFVLSGLTATPVLNTWSTDGGDATISLTVSEASAGAIIIDALAFGDGETITTAASANQTEQSNFIGANGAGGNSVRCATSKLDSGTLLEWTHSSTRGATLTAIELEAESSGQLLTVDSVVHVGNWTDDTGSSTAGDLATAIGGETANDSTFAQSEESPSSSPMVWKFSDGQTPGDATEPHTVTVRIKKDTTGGDQIDLTLELREGYTDEGTPGTLIASESFTDLTDTIAESTLTLSQAEAESVNDWTDLYGRVVANVGP